MRRETSITLITLLALLLALLLAFQVVVVPHVARDAANRFPEVEPLVVPAIVWSAAAILCWQAVAVVAVRLVFLGHQGTRAASALRWMRTIVACPLAYIVLDIAAVVSLHVMDFATPGLMLALIASGVLSRAAGTVIVIRLAAGPAVTPPRPSHGHSPTPQARPR